MNVFVPLGLMLMGVLYLLKGAVVVDRFLELGWIKGGSRDKQAFAVRVFGGLMIILGAILLVARP